MKAPIKGLYGSSKIGLWGKGNRATRANPFHRSGGMITKIGNEEKRNRCRGSLDACCAVDEYDSALLVFCQKPIRNFR